MISAYDCLKSDPRRYARLINEGWGELFNDPHVTYAVKQELKQMLLKGIPINDSTLFWNKQVVLNELIDGIKYSIKQDIWLSPWTEILYTVVQENQFEDKITRAAMILISNMPASLAEFKCSIETIRELLSMWNSKWDTNIAKYLLAAIAHKNTYTSPFKTISQISGELLLKHCSLHMLQNMRSTTHINNVLMLLRDTVGQVNKVFNSINELQEAHDQLTIEAETKLLAEVKSTNKQYVYASEFVQLVEKYGFHLPKNPEDCIMRGIKHSNCVARYTDKHTENLHETRETIKMYKLTRLLFSSVATIELSIYSRYDIICQVVIEQSKGKYNKEIPVSLDLVNLQVELTGCPVNIIKVEERECQSR